MSGANIIAIIILIAIIIAVGAYLLHWLYRRSTKDISFVRTGLGGEKVIMGGGAFVLPIVHDITEVNMNTLRLEVIRAREKSLITHDRMRAELTVEFYVRVRPEDESVATAARSLGNRTLNPEQLKELIQGRFVDAMGSAAAVMTLQDIHEKRHDFSKLVGKEVADSLAKDGLELESVSLTSLDQTDIALFNPSNTFDADGLTALTEQIQARRKKRNDIEQDTEVALRQKNLDAEIQYLDIKKESEFSQRAHEAEIAIQRAQRKAEIAKEDAARERETEEAKLREREQVERARIAMEKEIESMEIKRREALDIEEQEREIAIALKSQERAASQSEAERARAALTEARERVLTIRDTEIANRDKEIRLIETAKDVETEALRLRSIAEAEKDAAVDRAEAVRIEAEAEAERYRVEAAGKTQLNEAENLRSDASRRSALHRRLVDNLPSIIRESVKPMERIDEIKIMHVEGLPGFSGGSRENHGDGDGSADGGSSSSDREGNLADQVVSSALRYRSHAPFVDQLLGEIGLSGSTLHRTESLQDLSKVVYSEPASASDAPKSAPKSKREK